VAFNADRHLRGLDDDDDDGPLNPEHSLPPMLQEQPTHNPYRAPLHAQTSFAAQSVGSLDASNPYEAEMASPPRSAQRNPYVPASADDTAQRPMTIHGGSGRGLTRDTSSGRGASSRPVSPGGNPYEQTPQRHATRPASPGDGASPVPFGHRETNPYGQAPSLYEDDLPSADQSLDNSQNPYLQSPYRADSLRSPTAYSNPYTPSGGGGQTDRSGYHPSPAGGGSVFGSSPLGNHPGRFDSPQTKGTDSGYYPSPARGAPGSGYAQSGRAFTPQRNLAAPGVIQESMHNPYTPQHQQQAGHTNEQNPYE